MVKGWARHREEPSVSLMRTTYHVIFKVNKCQKIKKIKKSCTSLTIKRASRNQPVGPKSGIKLK